MPMTTIRRMSMLNIKGHKAMYSLDGELLSGELSKKQHRIFQGWAALHEDELRASWDIVHEGEQPYPIDPLK